MEGNNWYRLGDIANDSSQTMYYRGRRIERVYSRKNLVWFQILIKILTGTFPDKIHYVPNDVVDYTGAKILGIWSNRKQSDVTTRCVFYPKQGTVIEPSSELLGIVIAKLPNKTEYTDGQNVSYSGMSILAFYADGNVVDVTSECHFSVIEQSSIKPVSLIGILVAELPAKARYNIGEELNFSGVKILAVYTNGRVDDVTSECTFTTNGSNS